MAEGLSKPISGLAQAIIKDLIEDELKPVLQLGSSITSFSKN
jgi:hypothetical protein